MKFKSPEELEIFILKGNLEQTLSLLANNERNHQNKIKEYELEREEIKKSVRNLALYLQVQAT